MSWICSIALSWNFSNIFQLIYFILSFIFPFFRFLIFFRKSQSFSAKISETRLFKKASMQRAGKSKSWNMSSPNSPNASCRNVKSISYHHHPSPHFIHPPQGSSLPPLFSFPPQRWTWQCKKGMSRMQQFFRSRSGQ